MKGVVVEEGERRAPAPVNVILAAIRIVHATTDKEGHIGGGHGGVYQVLVAFVS